MQVVFGSFWDAWFCLPESRLVKLFDFRARSVIERPKRKHRTDNFNHLLRLCNLLHHLGMLGRVAGVQFFRFICMTISQVFAESQAALLSSFLFVLEILMALDLNNTRQLIINLSIE